MSGAMSAEDDPEQNTKKPIIKRFFIWIMCGIETNVWVKLLNALVVFYTKILNELDKCAVTEKKYILH